MATIFERKNTDESITYRVIIRRKYIPTLCLAFFKYEEAKEWVDSYEEKYIKHPERFQLWIKEKRLELAREREFRRKEIKR